MHTDLEPAGILLGAKYLIFCLRRAPLVSVFGRAGCSPLQSEPTALTLAAEDAAEYAADDFCSYLATERRAG